MKRAVFLCLALLAGCGRLDYQRGHWAGVRYYRRQQKGLEDNLFPSVGQDDLAVAGFAWDISVGVLCDAAGDDRYVVPSGGAGEAFNIGLAVLYDGEGKDEYGGGGLGRADPKSDYHPLEKAGGNFASLIDHGGDDDTFPPA